MKKFFAKNSISIILILLHFLNTFAISEIISKSYSMWYFKYFAIAYAVVGALFILANITRNHSYTIDLHESDVIRHNYLSNIDYIKKHTGLLEDDIILNSITKYNQQLELKENTDNKFENFEALYKHFKNLDDEEKCELLYQLPTEYHTKLLKEIIKDE